MTSISTHFFKFFFLLFLYFCVFCLLRRIPFKYGGSGRLLWHFSDVFFKSQLKSKKKLPKTLSTMFYCVEFSIVLDGRKDLVFEASDFSNFLA